MPSLRLGLAIPAFSLALAVACGPTDEPAPDVEATGQAAARAALPTPTPTDTPVPDPEPTPTPTPLPTPTPTLTPTLSPTLTIVKMLKKLLPSVVRVEAVDGTGSGFIISSDGLIITNDHLVGADLVVDVTLSDGSVREAIVIARATEEDVALLATDGYQMPAVEFGPVGTTAVGDEVVALGYAFDTPGLASMTRGLVSAFRPNAFGTLTAIETNAALDPGYSGGPLIDLGGRVIGISSAVPGEADGTGSAIAIDEAPPIISRLRAGDSAPLGRYVSQRFSHSIDVPPDWRVHEVLINVVYLRDEESSAEAFILMEAVQPWVTTDEYADTREALGVDRDLDFYERHSSREVTLAGDVRAWEIVETWKRAENDFHHKGKEYFFVHLGAGYSIYTQSERSEWDAIEPIMDDMIASFRFDAVSE